MVNANSLHHDVLGQIFSHLTYTHDLYSVASVNHAFYTACVPHLYANLHYRLKQAKRVPPMDTPFAVVLRHPEYAAHVRSIELRKIPLIDERPQPSFLLDTHTALQRSTNLTRFIYHATTSDALPVYLPVLATLPELSVLRILANLQEREQAQFLIPIQGKLKEIGLDYPSCAVLNVLPEWTKKLSNHLTTLSIFNASDLNETVLSTVLSNTPNLTGLHLMRCKNIDTNLIFRLTPLVPDLESLGFTIWDTTRELVIPAVPLSRLRNLALDTQIPQSVTAQLQHASHTQPRKTGSHPPSGPSPPLWEQLLHLISGEWHAQLTSMSFRCSAPTKLTVECVKDIVECVGSTLRSLGLIHCAVEKGMMVELIKGCPELVRLALPVPSGEVGNLAAALKHAPKLRALSDVADPHSSHGMQYAGLNRTHVHQLMNAAPKMRMVHTPYRRWTGIAGKDGRVQTVNLERRHADLGKQWYLPVDEL